MAPLTPVFDRSPAGDDVEQIKTAIKTQKVRHEPGTSAVDDLTSCMFQLSLHVPDRKPEGPHPNEDHTVPAPLCDHLAAAQLPISWTRSEATKTINDNKENLHLVFVDAENPRRNDAYYNELRSRPNVVLLTYGAGGNLTTREAIIVFATNLAEGTI